jgi:hypothetical protein
MYYVILKNRLTLFFLINYYSIQAKVIKVERGNNWQNKLIQNYGLYPDCPDRQIPIILLWQNAVTNPSSITKIITIVSL